MDVEELSKAIAAEIRRIETEEREAQEQSWRDRMIKPTADEDGE